MRLVALLALVGAASALPRSVRKANWASIPPDVKDEDLDLLFVHALWRHGDRAPEHEVPGCDKFSEDDWTFGGGGYGELSPEGMKMHFNLGRMLRDRYITKIFPNFISPAYNAKEIYIRSTDFNRTLISAYANVQGMFSGAGEPGLNFPTDVPEWPTGFVPIPVHTISTHADFEGRPSAPCARQDQLYEMVRESPEYQNYINDPQVSQLLKYLSDETGTDVTVDNIYELQDPFFCEKTHIDELLNQTDSDITEVYPWYYTGSVEDMVDWIVDQHEQFQDGTGNPGGINGIDISVELPKIRAGETLKLFVNNVHGVLNCLEDDKADSCRTFYKKLKYYALSAHDSTLAAFLTILGVKKYVVAEGYPNYSSALLLEVYQHNTTYDKYFKVLYHAGVNDTGKPITAYVRGCDIASNICPISVLDDLVAKYAYDGDMAELCATPPDGTPPSSTTAKAVNGVSTTPTSTSTTTKTTTTTTTTQTPTTSSVSCLSLLSAVVVMIISVLLRID